jgi:hypothetical protein
MYLPLQGRRNERTTRAPGARRRAAGLALELDRDDQDDERGGQGRDDRSEREVDLVERHGVSFLLPGRFPLVQRKTRLIGAGAGRSRLGCHVVDEKQPMSFEEVTARLLLLARRNAGRLTATQVEADERLASDQTLTSAAARALAASTNIFAFEEPDSRAWFPFSGLVVEKLRADEI